MSHEENGFIQLPPDSTGKKSGASGRLVVDYSGESSPNLFEVGQSITGGTSGAIGVIVGVNKDDFPSGEGQIFFEVENLTGTFVVNENLQISAVTYGTIKSTSNLDEIYYQKNIIIDRDSPNQSQKIDIEGAASVTFSDGRPSVESFGRFITAEPESVRQYVHAYSDLAEEYYDVLTGNGAITYVSDERSVEIDTGGTASGDSAERQSHFYHQYQPGSTMSVLHSVVLGDSGKSNVVQRWGLFDSNDGVFWELDGTTLYVVTRSSATGSPVDTRVAQADFSEDSLNGTRGFNLDLTKTNLYWIELQWLGVGIVKFGIFEEDGTKTTAHIFENPNNQSASYMRQATLPIRFESTNTGVAAGNSTLKVVCSAVQNFGRVKRQLKSQSIGTTYGHPIGKASGEMPILTLRPTTTFNGITNHTTSVIGDVSIFNAHAACAKVMLKRGVFPQTGTSWNSVTSSPVEWDEDSTEFLFNPDTQVWSTLIGSGETRHFEILNQTPQFQNDIGIVLLSDNVTQPGVAITAEILSPDHTDIYATISWKEMHL